MNSSHHISHHYIDTISLHKILLTGWIHAFMWSPLHMNWLPKRVGNMICLTKGHIASLPDPIAVWAKWGIVTDDVVSGMSLLLADDYETPIKWNACCTVCWQMGWVIPALSWFHVMFLDVPLSFHVMFFVNWFLHVGRVLGILISSTSLSIVNTYGSSANFVFTTIIIKDCLKMISTCGNYVIQCWVFFFLPFLLIPLAIYSYLIFHRFYYVLLLFNICYF